MDLSSEQKKEHYRAIVEALPEPYKSRASVNYGDLEVGPACVEIKTGWRLGGSRPTMKLSFSYDVTGEDLPCKERSWKLRMRDSKFCYDRIAGHIVTTLAAYDDLKAKRDKGRSIAEVRGTKLTDVFNQDALLSRLKLETRMTPTSQTVSGEVDINFSRVGKSSSTIRFNGESFTGLVSVQELTAEQVAALMVVINLDQLNLLDLISLADDSILGPSITKLTEEMGDA